MLWHNDSSILWTYNPLPNPGTLFLKVYIIKVSIIKFKKICLVPKSFFITGRVKIFIFIVWATKKECKNSANSI